MTYVAGADGTPGGWAVVIMEAGQSIIRKVPALSDILDGAIEFDIIAVDVPIGLLDAVFEAVFETGQLTQPDGVGRRSKLGDERLNNVAKTAPMLRTHVIDRRLLKLMRSDRSLLAF
jgi:hypothetical protein